MKMIYDDGKFMPDDGRFDWPQNVPTGNLEYETAEYKLNHNIL
jgi:hypothetical protein